jgi:pseudaminic acid biosynthesis-associated methylase
MRNWTGEFGKEYTDRNTMDLEGLDNLFLDNFGISRTALNKEFLSGLARSIRILEVGSNIGNQLLCLKAMGFSNLYGIEPQGYAVELSKKRRKGINIIEGSAFDIPFKDKYFDLVFTSGVLIHINPKDIGKALREIYRCSNKYIWGFEYYSPDYKEIIYRGKKGLLWKADFCKIYTDAFGDLRVKKRRFLKYLKSDNVDEMFLLEKTNAKI